MSRGGGVGSIPLKAWPANFSATGLSKLLQRKKKEKQVHIYIFKVASNQDNTNYLTTAKKPAAKPH